MSRLHSSVSLFYIFVTILLAQPHAIRSENPSHQGEPTGLSDRDQEIYRQVKRRVAHHYPPLGIGSSYKHILSNPVGAFLGRGLLQGLMFDAAREAPVEWLFGEQILEPLDVEGFKPLAIHLPASAEVDLVVVRLNFAKTDGPTADWASKTGLVDSTDPLSQLLRHTDNPKLILFRENNAPDATKTWATIAIIGHTTSTEGTPECVMAVSTYSLMPTTDKMGYTWAQNSTGWTVVQAQR